jgi:isopenicillin-N epimerase
MHDLAWDAAHALTERWRTDFATPREMVGSMVTVPLPTSAGATEDDATRLRLALLVEDRIEIPLHASAGRLWARVSTQIYNDTKDVMTLGEAVARRA